MADVPPAEFPKIKTSKLLTFETGGHLILGHEQEIRQKVSEFISQNR